jgi:hypothetical protein
VTAAIRQRLEQEKARRKRLAELEARLAPILVEIRENMDTRPVTKEERDALWGEEE